MQSRYGRHSWSCSGLNSRAERCGTTTETYRREGRLETKHRSESKAIARNNRQRYVDTVRREAGFRRDSRAAEGASWLRQYLAAGAQAAAAADTPRHLRLARFGIRGRQATPGVPPVRYGHMSLRHLAPRFARSVPGMVTLDQAARRPPSIPRRSRATIMAPGRCGPLGACRIGASAAHPKGLRTGRRGGSKATPQATVLGR